MSTLSRFAYAQARIQARYARLPTEEEWQRLAPARTLPSFLEEAREGAMREWVKGFSGQSDAHDLEVGVRNLFRETVDELAGWLPEPWRPAMSWTRWLPLLPLLDHQTRTGSAPPWLQRDPGLQGLLTDGRTDPGKLRGAGAGALADAPAEHAAAWVLEWRRLMPPVKRSFERHVDELVGLLTKHLAVFRDARSESAWDVRRALRGRLTLLLHRHLLQPASAFVFLGLTALDLERLRGELVSRALFAAGEGTV
jgi:hypothetical protein